METPTTASKLPASLSLIAGLLSLVLLLVFLFSTAGNGALIASSVLGVIGLVLAIAALRKRQSKAVAVTGLALSAAALLTAAAILVFALIFIGALTGSPM